MATCGLETTHVQIPLAEQIPKPWGARKSQPARLAVGACRILCCRLVKRRENRMYWTTPTIVEICIGLEINGYLPAEF